MLWSRVWNSGWSSLVMFFEGLAERCSDLREAELASAGTSGSRELSGDHLQSSTPPRIVAMAQVHASCRREKDGIFLSQSIKSLTEITLHVSVTTLATQ